MRRAIVLVLVLAGCGSSGSGSAHVGDSEICAVQDIGFLDSIEEGWADDSAVDSEQPDSGTVDLDWEPCPLIPGYDESPSAWCVVTDVPLFHGDLQGKRLPAWVMRLSPEGPVSAQMWMLQGGPGASGLSYGPTMARLAGLHPGLELLTLDHRGVGLSQRLGCPEQESEESEGGAAIVETEWPECIAALEAEWGEDLRAFSSVEAARDVLLLASRLRRPGVPVFVYGASYGTTLGHRVLQESTPDDQLAGVILDAPNWPDRTYDDYDALWSDAGRLYFQDCAEDPDCSSHLGQDPVGRIEQLWANVDAGHCGLLDSTSETLKALLAWMLPYEMIRPFAAAIAYRIERCDYLDVMAISAFYQYMFGDNGLMRFDSDERFSQVLLNHILYSEDAPFGSLTPEQLELAKKNCFLCIGAGSGPVTEAAKWPKYDFPQEYRTWAVTDIPVLFLSGEMDPFAPAYRLLESGVLEAFDGPGQYVIVVEGGAHGALEHAMPDDGSMSCGESILFQFIEQPMIELNTACLSELSAPSFVLPKEFVEAVLNTKDLWDN